MRQSKLFLKTQKEYPKDETSLNARLLIRANFVDKLMAGVYSFLPLGLRVLKKIETIIREEMNSIGGQEILMPALHPKEVWEKTNRWDNFEALYRLKGKDRRELALGPTHEEIIVPLAKKIISSYKDLPVYLYQIQTKFRDEPRPKSGLLRGREFLMKDLYSFHSSVGDLDKFYEKMKEVYSRVFKRCGLATIITEASGGTFSKYSHEFQVLGEAGEDAIYHCQCGFSQNKEIFRAKNIICPQCRKKKLQISRAIEVGNIFKLGTKYSQPFNLTFKTKKGKEEIAVMGCYGIGLGRVMGTIVEVYHDQDGLIWPSSVSPFDIHLVLIGSYKKPLCQFGEKVYHSLGKASLEVLYDDREKISAGEKFADADLIGIPWRLVISEKTLTSRKVEIKNRNEKKAKLLTLEQTIQQVQGK